MLSSKAYIRHSDIPPPKSSCLWIADRGGSSIYKRKWHGVSILVFAGAGIVEGTIPSLEWEELELKESQIIARS
ncbi:hypothetical protein MUK42_15327 [Musa troglodytarum]|uniref:Uncharacterized protein n=1 Tax=Musa troglodytarum TaxID=320322 RepID=A0A9E7I1J3_9LILI|nr:hypothetical protein MUK42_15327 [Musa troglodytarum]